MKNQASSRILGDFIIMRSLF